MAAVVPAGTRAATDIANAGIFELDGNIAHNSPTTPPFDWADLFDASGMPKPVGAPLLSSAFEPDYAMPDPTYYAGGNKDTQDISSWGCTTKNNPQDKTDIQNTYAAVFQPTSGPAAGHVLLYLGLERFSPNGDANLGFWLLHNPTKCVNGSFIGAHQTGDLLIQANFTNGGSAVGVQLLRWNPGGATPPLDTLISGADCPSAPAGTPFCGIANSQTITPPWPTGVSALQPFTFFEAGIDLTAALPGGDLCTVGFLANTRASQSIDAELKDFAQTDLAVCRSPTMRTDLSNTEVVIGGSVTDQATLTGATPAASGTVTYRVFAGPACSGAPVFTSTKQVVNGTVPPSDPFVPAAPGPYQWQVTYSGDTLNTSVTSVCGTEPLNVVKAQPGISTTPSATEVVAGTAVTDTATVTGGLNPTGTVSFQLFGPTDTTCSTPEASFPNIPLVNGSATSAPPFPITGVGTHRWIATYTGDANNLTVASKCGEETVTVLAAPATITTHPMPQAASVGTPISDSATVASTPLTPTGTVTFELFGPGNPTCGPPALATFGPIVLANGSATSGTHTVTQVGTYHWIARYSGDSSHSPATSTCEEEPVTIDKAIPAISTDPPAIEVVAGTSVRDTATVTGGFSPSGTVSFQLFGPTQTACTGTPVASFPGIPLVNGSATSPPVTLTTPLGTYRWIATYNGDANNLSVASRCGEETVTVLAILPTVTTQPMPQSASLGTPISDSVSVTSAPLFATGTVTFDLFGPASPTCAPPALATFGPITLTNGSATSGTHTVTQAGTYHWIAHYSGDSTHSAASSACQDEPVTVDQATPGISTAPSATEVVAGTPVTDTATVTGGFSPSGTVSFQLFGPTQTACTGSPVASFPGIPLLNGSATSPPFTVTAPPGTYRWIATFNGDGNNLSVANKCGDETVAVLLLPTVDTTPLPQEATITLGTAASDSATVTSAAPAPTGTVTFDLFGPGDLTCGQAPIATFQGLPLINGVATSGTFTVNQAGVYNWIAHYNGDSNHATADSLCGAEQVTVDKATPGISTGPDPNTATVGGQITDHATLSGAFNATGTVTFDIFGPSDPTCAQTPLASFGPITLSNGGATSPPFTPAVAGTYHWIAHYSGDQNNTSVSSVCADEPVVVAPATPALATTPSPGGPPGTPISDTASVTGGANPTGTVTFRLFGPTDTDCVGPPIATFAGVPLSGGVATSPSFTATPTGTYQWIAAYSGDAANAAVSTVCQAEHVVIDPPVPSITTSVSATGTVGTPLHDTATVSGGAHPTGTVTFQVFGPADPLCSGVQQVANFANVALAGGVATSPPFTPTLAGVHHWLVTYNGDSANTSTISQCADEAVAVGPTGVTSPATGAGGIWPKLVGLALLMAGTAVLVLATRLRRSNR